MVSVPLQTTKFYFPPPRPNLVPRPRLVERLITGLRGPLTLISAPAGYGKTTLLSPWGAVGWCLIGPLVGLIGDLTFKFLPRSVSPKWRVIIAGAVIGAIFFSTREVALWIPT